MCGKKRPCLQPVKTAYAAVPASGCIMVQGKNHHVAIRVLHCTSRHSKYCPANLHPPTRAVLDYACHLLCMHASASMGAQARPSKTPHQVLPSSLSSKTPATAGKPPPGRGHVPAAAVSKTPYPVSAIRDAASRGQLTNKLEKSSSTPLVEVVTGN